MLVRKVLVLLRALFSELGLSENSNPNDKDENESGKSSQFRSLIDPISTYWRHILVAKLRAVEFSDTPELESANTLDFAANEVEN